MKKLISLALAVIMLLCLCACSGDGSGIVGGKKVNLCKSPEELADLFCEIMATGDEKAMEKFYGLQWKQEGQEAEPEVESADYSDLKKTELTGADKEQILEQVAAWHKEGEGEDGADFLYTIEDVKTVLKLNMTVTVSDGTDEGSLPAEIMALEIEGGWVAFWDY